MRRPSGAVTIPWDAKAQAYSQLAFLARSIAGGDSPFWTPNVFAGMPQIADPQSLIFSPFFLLAAALVPEPSFVLGDAISFAMLAMGAEFEGACFKAPVAEGDIRELAQPRVEHGSVGDLQRTGRDERGARVGGGRDHAGQTEHDGPAHEHLASADPVSGAAEDDQQGREDERVDSVDPLRVDRGDSEVPDDVRERDIDDGGVHDEHRHAEADGRHRSPRDPGPC